MTTKIPVELSSTPGIVDGSNATAITIDSSENVAIGTTSVLSGNKLDVRGGNIMVGGFGNGTDYGLILTPDDGSGYFNIANITGGHLTFNNSSTIGSTERMRINSSGQVAIGTTSPDGVSNLTVKSANSTAGQELVSIHHTATSGTVYFMSFMTEASGADRGYITYNQSVMALATASDISLKENIRDLTGGLDLIKQIKPRVFDWKEEGKNSDQVGFIAQEIEEIKPEWVYEKEGIKLLSSNLPDSIPYLIKAIQEQQTQIEALQAEINTLKGE
jgi:hypothetical protein